MQSIVPFFPFLSNEPGFVSGQKKVELSSLLVLDPDVCKLDSEGKWGTMKKAIDNRF
jgi:hypothetical protein